MDKRLPAMLMVGVFIVAAFIPLLAGMDESDAANDTIVIESSPDFAPYDYYYGTEFAGIDMDILRAISNDIGRKIEFRPNEFASILLSVPQHKCDMGASGFTITEKRKESVLFTDDYAVIKQVVVAQAGRDLRSLSDLEGKVLTAQVGTSGADYAKEMFPDNPLKEQNGYAQVVLDIINGIADCEIVDDAVGKAQVSAYPEKLQVYDILTNAEEEHYGFIFAKDNLALYNLVNDSLKRLKADGTVDKIVQYYVDNNYSPTTPSYFNQVKTLFILDPEDSPYAYKLAGRNAGIDADILTAVAQKIGYRISFIDEKRVDMADRIAATPSYIGAGYLSIPDPVPDGFLYASAGLTDGLVILSKNGVTFTDVSELSGRKVAVLPDSSAVGFMDGKGATVTEYHSVDDAAASILSGDIDCLVADSVIATSLSARNSGLFQISGLITSADYTRLGFLMSADAGDLFSEVTAALDALRADGTIENIVAHYAERNYDMTSSSYFFHEPTGFFEKLWDQFKKDFIDNDGYKHVITGLGNTLKIAVVALVIGVCIGVLAAAVMSAHAESGRLRIPNAICRLYITVIRGTPVLVQLLLIYYVILVDFASNAILIAAIAFGLNSGAYVAEIVRSGINSVPRGQMEAARSLGLDTRTSMRYIIIPQAIRNILPALGNEGISLIKETSIAGYIAIVDLTKAADIIRMNTYDALLPLLVIAAIYLAIVLVLQFGIKKLERRLNSAY